MLNDDAYEDTTEILSSVADRAYGAWADAETWAAWADDDRKRRREAGIPNPLVEEWVASQEAPFCSQSSGAFECVLSAGHEGGCFMRAARHSVKV